MKVGDIVRVNMPGLIPGIAAIVEELDFGFVGILYAGSVRMMDKCYLEMISENE